MPSKESIDLCIQDFDLEGLHPEERDIAEQGLAILQSEGLSPNTMDRFFVFAFKDHGNFRVSNEVIKTKGGPLVEFAMRYRHALFTD